MHCLIIQISIKEFILLLKLSLKIRRCMCSIIFRQTGQGALKNQILRNCHSFSLVIHNQVERHHT